MQSLRWPSSPEAAGRAGTAECVNLADLRLPAHPAQLKGARDYVAAVAAEFGFSRKESFDLVFAVNEAVTNAIKHGSPDAEGTIGLAIDADGDSLVFTIRDSGPFVPRTTRSETTDEGGRGFAFMSAMTDEFELVVEPDATIVRLRKIRPGGAPAIDA